MLSPMDDYPVHQIAEPIRHVATSDRNFYDRYYFNCYPTESPDVFLIVGLGQYPNLGVMDAFAVLRRGDDHIVARMSKALGADRTDTTVGPLRIEVLEGLQKLRVVLEPGSEYDLSFDITFDATIPAALEPKHFRRQLERVTFDTSRFLQTGTWTGSLTVDGEEFAIDPKTWRGNRDRSWGVRPVGEAEPQGRRAVDGIQNFFWIYAVMQFDEFTISVIMQEDEQGRRIVEEAMRVWPDEIRDNEWLGRPEHELTFCPDTRDVTGATITFHRPGGEVLTVTCELLLANYIGIGTGYGLDALGSLESLAALDRLELSAHHSRHFNAANITLAIAGDFDPASTLASSTSKLALPASALAGSKLTWAANFLKRDRKSTRLNSSHT